MNNDEENGGPSFYGRGSRRRRKIRAIREALQGGETALFRQLALADGGLLRDEFRRQIWPDLLDLGYFKCQQQPTSISRSSNFLSINSLNVVTNSDDDVSYCTCCSGSDASSSNTCPSDDFTLDDLMEKFKSHREFEQVSMDVKRTLCRFPPNVSDERRAELQHMLVPLIVGVLTSDPTFQYYQGFHDVCLTVLLVFDNARKTFEFCRQLAHTYFKPFLTLGLELSCCKPLRRIYPLIYAEDRDLLDFLDACQIDVHFAVSWTLTWFAHVIDDYKQVVRLYDWFLASHPLTPVYLAASVVLYHGPDLMRQFHPQDMPSVHGFLTRWSDHRLPLEALVDDAQSLFSKYPPSTLDALTRRTDQWRERRAASLVTPRIPYRRALVWGVATAAAAYYFYNHYAQLLRL